MSNNLNPDWDRCNWFKYLLSYDIFFISNR